MRMYCVVEGKPLGERQIHGWYNQNWREIEHDGLSDVCPHCGNTEYPTRALKKFEKDSTTYRYNLERVDIGLAAPVDFSGHARIVGDFFVMACDQNPELTVTAADVREAERLLEALVREHYRDCLSGSVAPFVRASRRQPTRTSARTSA